MSGRRPDPGNTQGGVVVVESQLRRNRRGGVGRCHETYSGVEWGRDPVDVERRGSVPPVDRWDGSRDPIPSTGGLPGP